MTRTIRLTPWILGVVASGLVAVGASAEEPDFLAELNRARDTVREGPAKAFYDGPFSQAFYAKFSGWINECSQQTGRRLDDLDLVVTLGQDGKVQAVRFEPVSEGARCFTELVRKERFPSPPKGDFAVPVSVRMSKS